MASASIFIFSLKEKEYKKHIEEQQSHINVGSGEDTTIGELAELIKIIVGFDGKIVYDKSKPEGPPRKLVDISKLKNLGWAPKISLDEGLKKSYDWFLANQGSLRAK